VSHYGKIDPTLALWDKAAASGKLLQVSEALPLSSLRHDEWYEWLLWGGVCDILGTTLCESPSHKMSIGLHRAIGDVGPFPKDAEALQALMAPLCNAARLHLGLIEAGYRSTIMRGTLELLTAGTIFTSGDGQVVDANRAAERVLRLGDGLTIRYGKICARRNFETTKLNRLIEKAATSDSPSAGCMLIARDGGRSPYVVRVATVSAGLTSFDLSMAMILVSNPDETLISETELIQLYGLSPAESRVALALTQGKRMTELAREFGVQVTTLRTQLSSILKKCEVERQSDLVRLIGSIPVIKPLPSETTWQFRASGSRAASS
jgi:DNA-binding CsgD family transcriptional regulator/PAS domain-containing protein